MREHSSVVMAPRALWMLLLCALLAACGGSSGANTGAAITPAAATTTPSNGTTTATGTTGSAGTGGSNGSSGATNTSGSTNTSMTTGAAADDGLIGWATAHSAGAPTGGFAAIDGKAPVTCTATSMRLLRDCLYRSKKTGASNDDPRVGAPNWSAWEVHNGVTGGWKDYPVVIFIKGRLDANVNDSGMTLAQAAYETGTEALCAGKTRQPCQQAVTQAKLERGNISVLGVPGDDGTTPEFYQGWLMVSGQSNVIVRNLRFVPATDFWPSFESCSSGITDQDYCAWNAEPDAMTIVGGNRVWVDHCEFTDGPELQGAQTDKSRYKYYDGLLDIKSGADYVTVSYSRFYNHHKAMLIGATDSNDGDYRITFHHNHIQWVNQRMPRVRNGQVHILNNVYAGPKQADYTQQYYFGYGIGLGYNSKVYSERNAFDIAGAAPSELLSANFDKWAQYFTDAGSWLNGATVDLNAVAKSLIDTKNNGGSTPFIGAVTWSPAASYAYTADTGVDALRAKVAASAGVGKVSPVPSPYTVSP
ncbi:pectate lyase family protein [Variovorax sp. LjRoot178]|uniref:pectate lyase family protein n=1 Tax=Variovorax sp. LjRoot178 TaxID=3342277 RepID=UPI003ECE749D